MSGPQSTIRIGFMPLLDAAIPVVAARMGFAEQQGLHFDLVRETSWANIRDRLAIGHFVGAHLLAPLPIAAALGLTPFDVPLIAPMTLGHGGNAITVSVEIWQAMKDAAPEVAANDPASTGSALRNVIARRRKAGAAPLTFAVVHAISSHNYELRHWLDVSGIAPDYDVQIAIVPPPYMPDALAAGRIDGFCVGEPWNSFAAQSGSGAIILSKAAIWPQSPDKVLAMRADWTERNAGTVDRMMVALVEAAQWCSHPANRERLVDIMADPAVLDVPAATIRPALTGLLMLADGAHAIPDFIEFAASGANLPRIADAQWYLRQMIRWSQTGADAAPDLSKVYRADLYAKAAATLGLALPQHDAPVLRTYDLRSQATL